MNRIEIVGLFTALKTRVDENDMESIRKIVEAVLDEAQYVKPKSTQKQSDSMDD